MKIGLSWLLRASAISAALFLLQGCYLRSDGQDVERRLDQLQARHEELAQSYVDDQQQLRNLLQEASTQIGSMDSTLAEARDVLSRNNADLSEEIETLRSRTQELRGAIEESEQRSITAREDLDIRLQDLEFRIQQLEGDGGR